MTLINADCHEALKDLPDNSVDSLVTDPPAGIGFMGKAWDKDKGGRDQWINWIEWIFIECRRVMKPGAHGLVWALPRTSHWTATALEDAGFDVRDVVTHVFGSGFPKSHNISKALDKKAGAEEDAKQWDGWGTALKPASEHWILVRKPFKGTVADNVLKHGVGGLNIDGSRIGIDPKDKNLRPNGSIPLSEGGKGSIFKAGGRNPECDGNTLNLNKGRFPANFMLSHTPYCTEDMCDIECAIKMLDEQSESVSRFFYCAKPSKRERNAGLDCLEIININYNPWEKEDQKVQLQVDTAQSVPRVTAVLDAPQKNVSEWNTLLFGNHIMDPSQKANKYTTKTTTRLITKSKTLNWLLHYNTSACIQDVNSEQMGGGSHVGHVESLSLSVNTIKEKMESATSAKLASKREFLEIQSSGNKGNIHSTVKSKKLMNYLITMITPPGGTVLDPFMGSGSTGVAASEAGFQFTGIEQEPEYFEIAQRRINGPA